MGDTPTSFNPTDPLPSLQSLIVQTGFVETHRTSFEILFAKPSPRPHGPFTQITVADLPLKLTDLSQATLTTVGPDFRQ